MEAHTTQEGRQELTGLSFLHINLLGRMIVVCGAVGGRLRVLFTTALLSGSLIIAGSALNNGNAPGKDISMHIKTKLDTITRLTEHPSEYHGRGLDLPSPEILSSGLLHVAPSNHGRHGGHPDPDLGLGLGHGKKAGQRV
jgi:hypothetical protein